MHIESEGSKSLQSGIPRQNIWIDPRDLVNVSFGSFHIYSDYIHMTSQFQVSSDCYIMHTNVIVLGRFGENFGLLGSNLCIMKRKC